MLSLDNDIYVTAMNLSYSILWIRFWEVVAFFGDGWVVYPSIGVVGVFFLIRARRRSSYLFVVMMIASFCVNTLLKLLFQLDRPVSLSPFTDLTTYSFPSGHAFNAFVMFYFLPRFLAFVFPDEIPWFYLSRIFAVIGILMVGLSRIFLGVHWASDVLGGWMLGGVITTLLLNLLIHTSTAPG